MRLKTLALSCVAASIAFTAACATMRVGSYVERNADFSRYQTYAWGPADALPIGDPRLDNNGIFLDRLQGAVERGLRNHHLLLVPASSQPDLLVHFHGSVRQILDVTAADRNHGYDVPHDVGIVDYEEGTLVLDVIDARTDRLVWRGWAVDSLSGILESQDRMEKKIEQAVASMLAQFKVL